jgi:hypothetical protein
LIVDEQRRCSRDRYDPPPERAPRVRATAPETSHAAAKVAALREGTQKKTMWRLFVQAGERGYTDDELEQTLARSHQSVSATRNGLMNDGLIVDSGQRRKTRYGNEAIVWVAVR